MIGDLSNELHRLIAVYRNRTGLFHLNGKKPAFSMKDVVRHHLFAKAESSGFTPIPNVAFLDWRFDLICLRGARPQYVFVIREEKDEDYRQLLLLPRTMERVLIVLTKRAVPDEQPEGIVLIRVAKNPTSAINAALSARRIIEDFSIAFKEVYGFSPMFSPAQMTSPAGRIANFWLAHAVDLNFREYCTWFMETRQASRADLNIDRVVDIKELLDKTAVATFRVRKAEKKYDDRWTRDGWSGLDS